MCCVFARQPMQLFFSLLDKKVQSARISANEHSGISIARPCTIRRVDRRVTRDVRARGQGHRVIPPVHSTWMENESVVEQRHSISFAIWHVMVRKALTIEDIRVPSASDRHPSRTPAM
jgi:hypothetical protein